MFFDSNIPDRVRKISLAVEHSKLAPSSHNCQPWRVISLPCNQSNDYLSSVCSERTTDCGTVVIGLDEQAMLKSLSALKNEMYMSLGGFATLLLNFLQFQGIGVEVCFAADRLESGFSDKYGFTPELIFILSDELSASDKNAYQDLLAVVNQRYTLRCAYHVMSNSAFSGVLKYSLSSQSDDLSWVSCHGDKIEAVCTLMQEEGHRDFSHKKSWSETYRFIDFSAGTESLSGTGFNIQQLLGPTSLMMRFFYKIILSPYCMPVTKLLGLPNAIAKDISQLIKTGNHLVYLKRSQTTADNKTKILAGEKLLDYWLVLTRSGAALHPLSVLIQHPIINTRLHTVLSEADEILFIARTGKPFSEGEFFKRFRSRKRIDNFYVTNLEG